MIRVAYFTHEYNVANGSTYSLLNMLHALREDVKPLVIFPKEGSTVNLFRSKGIECKVVPFITYHLEENWKLPLRRIKYAFMDQICNIKSRKRLTDLLKNNKIELIHTNTSVIGIGYEIARKLGIPHIWHIREFIDADFNCKPLYGFKRLIRRLHNSNATISISKAVQSRFNLDGMLNAYQVYNAVVDEVNQCITEDKAKFFMLAGHLIPQKGIKEAIEAFSIFVKRNAHGDYMLKLIGEIDLNYKNSLLDRIRELELNDKIEFVDYSRQLDIFYRQASGFLMCSKNEGLGRVSIEAMNYGCPVIGYNSGGTAELIRHNENGLLYNNIEECADMMDRVLTLSFRTKLEKNAIQFVKNNFTEKVFREKILEIYRFTLNR